MTLRRGAAARLTVYLHGDARWQHHAVSEEIIRRAHEDGLGGASRFEGFMGYGSRGVLHDDLDPDICGDLPCAVEIVDPSEERLRRFVVRIEEILDHGLVILEPIEIAAIFSESPAEAMRA